MKLIRAVDQGLSRLENGLLALVLVALMVQSVLQIALRNLFGTSWFWIDPLNRMMVLWLAILGAMVATRKGEHIAIDVLRHYLTGWPAQLTERLASGFAAFVTGIMAWHSARFVYEEWLYDATAVSGLPSWPFQLIMPVGFALICLRFVFSTLGSRTSGDL